MLGYNPYVNAKFCNLKSNLEILEYVNENLIDLTIVGPEAYLEQGITDLFLDNKKLIIGPTKQGVKIETSKSFCKEIMKKYYIPTASYEEFINYNDAYEYKDLCNYPIVVKYSGPALGKGVIICNDEKEYIDAISLFLKEKIYGEECIVVEEFLDGEEFSFISLCNNLKYSEFLSARDYKRINDNDQGPNTGGMGMVVPHKDVKGDVLKQAQEITQNMLKALDAENINYCGFLYAGLIITKSGVKVIEFNARMGDPEGELLFKMVDNDLLEQLYLCSQSKEFELINSKNSAVGVVLSAPGYPSCYEKGIDISSFDKQNTIIMNANSELKSTGGRVLFSFEIGDDIKQCRNRIYERLEKIETDLHYRNDIGVNL